jgi:ComF family protein
MALTRWLDPVLDLVFPAVCPVCATRSDDPVRRPFCGACWAALPIGLGPGCAVCGEPFPGLGGALACEACRRAPPPYAFARAVAAYETGMREAIHALKYGGRAAVATPLGQLLAETGPGVAPAPLDEWADALVPVPLHRARLAERGFNQAEVLAQPCGVAWRLPVLERALVRTRPTAPQTDLDAEARRRNVRDAFGVVRPAQILGRRLVLVDDVFTTGATVAAAARALRAAGAAAVAVLTLARVVRR